MRPLLLLVLLCLLATRVAAVELASQAAPVNVSAAVEVLEDPAGQWTLDEVRSPAAAAQFRPSQLQGNDLNLGVTGSAVWLRLSLRVPPGASGDWLLVVPYGQIDRLDVFVPGRAAVNTGSDMPLASRPYFHRHFVVPLRLPPGGGEQVLHLRARSSQALTVPVELWPPDAFNAHNQRTLMLQGLYTGGLLALTAYNLLLWRTLRDRRFMLCGLYSLLIGAAILAGNGFGRLFLWPDAPDFDGVSQPVLLCAALAAAAALTRAVLSDPRPRGVLPGLLSGLALLSLLDAAVLLLSVPLAFDRRMAGLAMMLLSVVTLATMAGGSLRDWWRGRRDLRYFAAAWCVLLVGGLVATLRATAVLPTNVVTAYAVQLATTVEMMLLALAMTDIVRAERLGREAAQAAARQANEQAIAALRLSGEQLDQAVRERTLALSTSLRQLEEARSEQQQLLSIASHEFRTPSAIIKASVDSLRLLRAGLPDDVQERLDNIGMASRRLLKLSEEFIQQDRLGDGHLALRLTRIDLADVLHSALDGLRGADGQAPAVHCQAPDEPLPLDGDAPLLAVAVQNLLDNALRHNPPDGPPVQLRAWRELSSVGPVARIEVRDRGPGVPDADKARVFERFVTTRGQVPGAGLGLSIVQRIVQAHQGEVTLSDAQPQGAVFQIVLPLAQPRHRSG